jgi:ATP-dependent DNA helicase RecG
VVCDLTEPMQIQQARQQSRNDLRKLIARALDEVDLTDTLPVALVSRLKLQAFDLSVRSLHAPPSGLSAEALTQWQRPFWQRVAFDELLAQQISLRQAYAARRSRGAPVLAGNGELIGRLLAQLPFKLTAAAAHSSIQH